MLNQAFNRRFTPLLAVFILLAGCGNGAGNAPQAIDEDVDICATCTMMVQDNQFSAQIVEGSGEVFKFDDIGCMAMYINNYQPEGQPFVRDFYSKEWIAVDNALFVATADVETPMNYGFLPFANQENLDKFLSESSGEELTWATILEKMKERSS